MSGEAASVAAHYGRGGLLERIFAGAEALGAPPGRLSPEHFALFEHMHTGGAQGTEAVLDLLDLGPDAVLLDCGSGLGGVAREAARRFGCSVVGVDLTPEYVEAAEALTALSDVAGRVTFTLGSIAAPPVDEAAFDAAIAIHVCMNIADKPAVFAAVRRALKPGAVFALFDPMLGETGAPVAYPNPWAATDATSFLATPEAYITAAEAAGFVLSHREDRTARTLAEPPRDLDALEALPLGPTLFMREDMRAMVSTYRANIESGAVAPTELAFRAI